MSKLPKLNLPSICLRAKSEGGRDFVWDAVRGTFLVLTPEEWVRQHILGYLVNQLHISPQRISLEHPVDLNGMAQRADIVVFGKDAEPEILVECKAPDITISEATLAQAVRYNSVVKARYIMLSNGLETTIYAITDEGRYRLIKKF
ncbi:MAG: type I restriction enzyme HsdR N-terminal domain-containing protein [Alistipes sp.]|nr:type I restriction enzyme HsdR N-terminal domain-containing protein [Alistipes sp.]